MGRTCRLPTGDEGPARRRALAWLAVLSSVLVVACGARTGLDVPDGGAPAVDAPEPEPPCEGDPPELFSSVAGVPLAADGRRLWVDVTDPELPVGFVDTGTGELRVVATEQFGVQGAVARGGQAWWTSAGLSDFAGELSWARSPDDTRVLDDGLFWPGGVQHDDDWLYYAEWTNSGSLRDEGRGRILRIAPDGGRPVELAAGLGLPTSTALAAEHVYWVDRRRNHVARVPRAGGAVEVVAEVRGIRSVLAAGRDGLLFSVAGDDRIVRLGVPDHAQVELATLPGEVRGIASTPHGLLLFLWAAPGPSIRSLWLLPNGSDEPVLLDAHGASPVVGSRWAYWSRARATGDVDGGLVRVCLDYLATL